MCLNPEKNGFKLEDIGFYTLSNYRALNATEKSPLWRCELLLTDRCTFKCPYCRGMQDQYRGDLSKEDAFRVVDLWIAEGLVNVRFSGGEPTVWKHLPDLVKHCKDGGVKRIAVSTNGYNHPDYYAELIHSGVNDLSISLDACCATIGDAMSGGIKGAWEKVVRNIELVSRLTYTTVGMVFTEQNIGQAKDSVRFAASLGVQDIRVVPSAQYNEALVELSGLGKDFLSRFPILQYRINNVLHGRNVRSMVEGDCSKCRLALDDMAVVAGYHFPCIIYLREGGKPIGKVGPNMREERRKWVEEHDSFADPICREMCLDVCVDYNNVAGHV